MTEITHAKALLAIAAKPTHALARKLAEAKGYEIEVWFFRYGGNYHGQIYYVVRGKRKEQSHVSAPTRTAALSGLIAVIDALPKRKGKR